jgi:hypothetical protein
VTLAAYLLSAMVAWFPCRLHRVEPIESCTARYESIAADVAAVVSDPAERVANVAQAALRLVAIADLESGFALDVDDLSCNAARGKKRCDQAGAWSIWQIHIEGGIVLDARGFRKFQGQPLEWQDAHASEVIRGPDFRDRKVAARVALHMLRQAGVEQWTQGRNARALSDAWLYRHPGP